MRGRLGQWGYSLSTPLARDRRQALARALKSDPEGPLSILRRLNVLRTFNKNKTTKAANNIRSDFAWVQKQYAKYYKR
jgi:hypothetical protein